MHIKIYFIAGFALLSGMITFITSIQHVRLTTACYRTIISIVAISVLGYILSVIIKKYSQQTNIPETKTHDIEDIEDIEDNTYLEQQESLTVPEFSPLTPDRLEHISHLKE